MKTIFLATIVVTLILIDLAFVVYLYAKIYITKLTKEIDAILGDNSLSFMQKMDLLDKIQAKFSVSKEGEK